MSIVFVTNKLNFFLKLKTIIINNNNNLKISNKELAKLTASSTSSVNLYLQSLKKENLLKINTYFWKNNKIRYISLP